MSTSTAKKWLKSHGKPGTPELKPHEDGPDPMGLKLAKTAAMEEQTLKAVQDTGGALGAENRLREMLAESRKPKLVERMLARAATGAGEASKDTIDAELYRQANPGVAGELTAQAMRLGYTDPNVRERQDEMRVGQQASQEAQRAAQQAKQRQGAEYIKEKLKSLGGVTSNAAESIGPTLAPIAGRNVLSQLQDSTRRIEGAQHRDRVGGVTGAYEAAKIRAGVMPSDAEKYNTIMTRIRASNAARSADAAESKKSAKRTPTAAEDKAVALASAREKTRNAKLVRTADAPVKAGNAAADKKVALDSASEKTQNAKLLRTANFLVQTSIAAAKTPKPKARSSVAQLPKGEATGSALFNALNRSVRLSKGGYDSSVAAKQRAGRGDLAGAADAVASVAKEKGSEVVTAAKEAKRAATPVVKKVMSKIDEHTKEASATVAMASASGLLNTVGVPLAVALGAPAALAPVIGGVALLMAAPVAMAATKGIVSGAGRVAGAGAAKGVGALIKAPFKLTGMGAKALLKRTRKPPVAPQLKIGG